MTWAQMGEQAYIAWSKGFDGTNPPLTWDEIKDDHKAAWIYCAKVVYNAASGDLIDRIGRYGL